MVSGKNTARTIQRFCNSRKVNRCNIAQLLGHNVGQIHDDRSVNAVDDSHAPAIPIVDKRSVQGQKLVFSKGVILVRVPRS